MSISISVLAEDSSPFDMSLEELSQLEVTSVTRNKSKAEKSPAAVFVISRLDIERSSATSVPELLRMVPGLQVAKINSSTWAITARGFNGGFSNKLLVLIDGRSVYDPVFSGVNWDQIDLVFQDIERIEVIRGPGATVWGANAVNGVINIITKNSSESQGSHVSVGAGSEDSSIISARQGGKIGENGFGRIYVKTTERDNSKLLNGTDSYDSWRTAQTGFRLDQSITDKDKLFFSGDLQVGRENGDTNVPILEEPYNSDAKVNGIINSRNILGRWSHEYSEDSNLFIQAYYNQLERDVVLAHEKADSYDLEVQQSLKVGRYQVLTAGVGYRLVNTKVVKPNISELPNDSFIPSTRNYDITNLYLQDEIELIPSKVKATLGTKFEYRNYTGLQVQPGIRLSYLPTEKQLLWASIAKAVRTPSQVERDVNFPYQAQQGEGGLTNLLAFQGNHDIDSENLIAYEVGYRSSPVRNFTFDISTFINSYSGVIDVAQQDAIATQADDGVPFVYVPLQFQNKERKQIFGTEVSGNWEVLSWWRLSGWYSYLDADIIDGSNQTNPYHQIMFRSLMTVLDDFEIDPTYRYVDSLRESNTPAYSEVDFRLGYRYSKDLVLSLIGKNLLDPSHREFAPEELRRPITQNERAIFIKFEANF